MHGGLVTRCGHPCVAAGSCRVVCVRAACEFFALLFRGRGPRAGTVMLRRCCPCTTNLLCPRLIPCLSLPLLLVLQIAAPLLLALPAAAEGCVAAGLESAMDRQPSLTRQPSVSDESGVMTAAGLAARLNTGALLVLDVRSAPQFQSGHIAGSIRYVVFVVFVATSICKIKCRLP